MKMWQIIFYVTSICCFTGCRQKIKKQKIKKSEKQLIKKDTNHYQQLLALHNEIPDTLLGFEVDIIRQETFNSSALEVVYKPIKNKIKTQQDIKKSYVADMEMLGWKMIGEFVGEVIQLIFQKAGTKLLSTVVIEPNLEIRITVYAKK